MRRKRKSCSIPTLTASSIRSRSIGSSAAWRTSATRAGAVTTSAPPSTCSSGRSSGRRWTARATGSSHERSGRVLGSLLRVQTLHPALSVLPAPPLGGRHPACRAARPHGARQAGGETCAAGARAVFGGRRRKDRGRRRAGRQRPAPEPPRAPRDGENAGHPPRPDAAGLVRRRPFSSGGPRAGARPGPRRSAAPSTKSPRGARKTSPRRGARTKKSPSS